MVGWDWMRGTYGVLVKEGIVVGFVLMIGLKVGVGIEFEFEGGRCRLSGLLVLKDRCTVVARELIICLISKVETSLSLEDLWIVTGGHPAAQLRLRC